jgi:DNA-binding NarL/FixJ family response regulator
MNRRAPDLMLTPRERGLVRAVVSGQTNREIANELHLGEQAVKNVLSIVYQKCHVRNRLEIAMFAVRDRPVSDGCWLMTMN